MPFTYDRETFPFQPSQRAEDFYMYPMPDSPPRPMRRIDEVPNPRNPGRFFGPGTSRRLAGAGGASGGAMDTGGESSDGPPPMTAEERIAQMEAQMSAMRTENVQLLEELTQARAGDKGKNPDRGRPSGPPLRKPRTDHFSLPRPPNYHPPEHGPLGEWSTDPPAPFLSMKPTFERPAKFKGEHDDIDRFLGDCATYFELFRHIFAGISSLMIVSAASLLEGVAQDWWVDHRETYLYTPDPADDDDDLVRYRYPEWTTFCELIRERFRDPAVEEVHEKRMGELKMTGTAVQFFQKLEREAKLAALLHDTGPRGTMVRAVRQGVPTYYTRLITSLGFGIPVSYAGWKERILQMYMEQEKDRVYNQTHGISDKKPQWGTKAGTASGKPPAGGTSGTTQPKSNPPSREPTTGRWHSVTTTNYGKQGEPMDVDRAEHLMKELCFNCHQQGHLSRDCPAKKQQVRAVVTAPIEEPAQDAKKAVMEKE